MILLLAISLLLGACQSTTTARDPLTLPTNSGLSAVVVSITANTGEIRGFTRLSVHRLPAPGEEGQVAQYFLLERQGEDMSRDTALFIGAMPPGRYAFSRLDDDRTSKHLWLRENGKLLGEFTVEAGTALDLGRLIVTPVNNKVVFGRSVRVASNRALLERLSPAHLPLFAAGPVIGWGRERSDGDKVEEYALARPVGAACPTELPNGAVVAASRLGTVHYRSVEGNWRALRGPAIDSLLCVIPADLPNAELLVVGEFGTLLRKPPNEDRLVPVETGNLPPGNLIRIAGNRKAGWYIALEHNKQVTLFHTPDLASGKWAPLQTLDIGFDLWHGKNQFFMWSDAQGLGVANTVGPIHRLDYASGTWTRHDTPGKARLTAVSADPAGSMSALTSPGGGFGGVFADVWISNDKALSWQPVTMPFKIKTAPVQRAWDGAMYAAGGGIGKGELQVSKDQGKTWTLLTEYELGRELLPLRSGKLLDFNFAQFGFFSIGSSADGGKTWVTEYHNFDHQAYEAGKR